MRIKTRSYKRSFNTNDLSFLQHIGNDRPESLPEEMRNRIEHFMINHFVMIYGNDTEWYDIHPIVRNFIEMTNG